MNDLAVRKSAITAGARLEPIIPTNIDQVYRLAEYVVRGGLAPYSLVGKLSGEDAIAAVAVCIMSGMELGLQPFYSLRAMAVINGRPALYGDGLIAVVRGSGLVETMNRSHDAEKGWCYAKRRDTGEESRVEFTKQDAIRARLWDEREQVRRKYGGNWQDVPNDSPWFKHPGRMMMWRATGYCLRDLFADVLGGIVTVDEAQEIAGEYNVIESSPAEQETPRGMPPSAPPEDLEPESEEDEPEQPDEGDENEPGSGAWFSKFEEACEGAQNIDDLQTVYEEWDIEAALTHAPDDLTIAQGIYDRFFAKLHPMASG